MANDQSIPDTKILVERLVSAREKELTAYANRIIQRMSNFYAKKAPSGESMLQTAILKTLNAETALDSGHARIVNDRIQLTRAAKQAPAIAALFAGGMRLWRPDRHSLEGFIKLVILSEIRAFYRSSLGSYQHESLDQEDRFIPCASTEMDASDAYEIETFISSIDDNELRSIAELVLVQGLTASEMCFELGLTRSQVSKRINKVMEIARSFSREKR